MNSIIKQHLREKLSPQDYYDLVRFCKDNGQLIGIVAVNKNFISSKTLENLIKKVQENGKDII